MGTESEPEHDRPRWPHSRGADVATHPITCRTGYETVRPNPFGPTRGRLVADGTGRLLYRDSSDRNRQPQLQSRYLGDLRWAARQSRIYPGFNHAIFVVGTALIFPTAALGCLLLAVLPIEVECENTVSTSTMILIFMLVFGFPLAAIPCYAWISSRIIARHPVECWPPATLDHSFGNLVETPPHPMRSADASWRSEL